MDIYKILHILVLCCVINEGLAWFGRSSSSSSNKDTSKKSSSSSNNNNGSSRRGSGWWGGSRNRPSKPASNPKPRPNPPAPKPKPKPTDTGKKSSGWWSGRNRNVPKPKPKPQPEVKKPADTKSKGWWSGKSKGKVPEPKPQPKQPSLPSPSKPKSLPSQPKTNTKSETDMAKVIEGYEGLKLKAYDAQPKNPKVHDTTVGIGFNLNRPDAEKTFKKVVPNLDFNKVKSGKQTITEDQARALFKHDLDKIYEPRAKDKIGKDVYDKLPSNVKTAVVNAVYRGDLGPKTTQLIKDGKWSEVGKEYLDHNQYKNADKLGIPGVKTRMDWNKEQFDTMIKPKK